MATGNCSLLTWQERQNMLKLLRKHGVEAMEVCLARIHDRPVLLELKDGVVYIDGEAEPIKNLTEEDLREFQEELDSVPDSGDEGHEALLNAIRAAFLAKLLGKAVGDECVNRISHVLDHVHYDVLKYLGEVGE